MAAQSSTDSTSRALLWAGGACIAFAWMAEITSAALGKGPAWPNWLMLVAITGILASNLLRPARPKTSVILIVAMAALSVVALIGIASAR